MSSTLAPRERSLIGLAKPCRNGPRALAVQAMAPYARHGVNVNVDFYSGVVYHLLGIKRDLFVPIFAVGRVPGWVVQVLEQIENNILIRPLTLYSGPELRSYRPLGER
jgi:citrate synthase